MHVDVRNNRRRGIRNRIHTTSGGATFTREGGSAFFFLLLKPPHTHTHTLAPLLCSQPAGDQTRHHHIVATKIILPPGHQTRAAKYYYSRPVQRASNTHTQCNACMHAASISQHQADIAELSRHCRVAPLLYPAAYSIRPFHKKPI